MRSTTIHTTLALLLLLFLACLAAAQDESQWSGPRIRWDKTVHDFGDLRSDQKAEFTWQFHNVGDQPLRILRTRTSCGCTMTLVESEVVQPGASGTLLVEFDAAGMDGSVRKNLTVFSNDPLNQHARLTVRANVTRVEPPREPGSHPPITGQSLLMGECAACHAAPAAGLNGEPLYRAVCAMCHGATATGALAPSLRHPSYLDTRSDEELSNGITYGTANPHMPGFSELMGGPLTGEQIRTLVRLLRDWGSTDAAAEPAENRGG